MLPGTRTPEGQAYVTATEPADVLVGGIGLTNAGQVVISPQQSGPQPAEEEEQPE